MPPLPDPHTGEPNDQDQALLSIMGQEANAELIRVLEKQIEEGSGDIIKLKRARNSLLNISTRVPPEILGDISSWNLVRPDPDPELDMHFYGSPQSSYNFLLVCHHWFQVASQTPTLWSFCGNNVWDWEKWLRRHPQSTPLDLVLNDESFGATKPSIDHAVQDALKDRAAQDTIRQVHLRCHCRDLVSPVISLLTPDGEGVQRRSIESIDLRYPWMASPFDVSKFFTRVHLPKLRSLLLHDPLILSSLDHLAQQTTVLTTLSLRIYSPPTTPLFFPIPVQNYGLQVLSLDSPVIPEDDDEPTSQVTLQNLERLDLTGNLHCVTRMLERLTFPRPLRSLQVTTVNSAVKSVLQTLGPYVRQYFRSDRGLWSRLKLRAQASCDNLAVYVENQDGAGDFSQFSAEFVVRPAQGTSQDVAQNLCRDFVTLLPQEHVSGFRTNLPPNKLENLLIAMPKIETLELLEVDISEGFLRPNPDGPHSKSELLPSLRFLCLGSVALSDNSWGPLMTYLGHQASDCQTISLKITSTSNGPHMCPEVVKEIEGLVVEFSCDVDPTTQCTLGRCRGGVEKSKE